MTSIGAGQGQGRYTKDKERAIGAALSVGLRIAANHPKLKPYPYWHIDVCAGSGWNSHVNVPGSPMVFCELAESIGKNYEAWFIEIDHGRAAELGNRLASNKRCYVFNGDNAGMLEMFSKRICRLERAQYAIGSVLIDPNGWLYRGKEGLGFNPSELELFAEKHPRIDIVLNLNVRSYRTQKAQRENGHAYGLFYGPSEFQNRLSRKHWLISEIANYGGSSWIRMIGRNIRTDSHPGMGHHHIKSDRGRQILEQIEVPKLQRVSVASDISTRAGGGNADGQLSLLPLF